MLKLAFPTQGNTILEGGMDHPKASRSRNKASPAKLKSPLASISSFNRHIAKRTPSRGPFSPLNINLSLAKAIYPSPEAERRVDLAGQSVGGEERIVVSCEDSLPSPSMVLGATSEPEIQEEKVADARLPVRQLNFEGPVMDNSNSNGVEGRVHEPSNAENIPIEKHAKKLRSSSKRRIEENGELKLPSEAVISEETLKEGGETMTSELTAIETTSKKRKVDGAQRDRKKDAGIKWENDVRRSSRIRMRPLEFWKGERFLYGRVNESLATVIGVKYASP